LFCTVKKTQNNKKKKLKKIFLAQSQAKEKKKNAFGRVIEVEKCRLILIALEIQLEK
jgi:hypothetical protein